MKVSGICFSLALLLTAPVQADESLQKMLDCMRVNIPAALRVQRIELETTDRAGAAHTIKGRLYSMLEAGDGSLGSARAMLRIDAPEYLAGAAFLVREGKPGAGDEMYVFLPTVKRVRRVIGDGGYDAMLGTNFSYADFKQIENGFGDVPASLEAPQEIEQRPVYVVSLTARPGASGNGYSAIRSWVDQKTCVALKVDFYDGPNVRKEFSAPAAALRQFGADWYLSRAQMRDLRDGTSTQLRVVDVSSGGQPEPRLFDPKMFYLAGK